MLINLGWMLINLGWWWMLVARGKSAGEAALGNGQGLEGKMLWLCCLGAFTGLKFIVCLLEPQLRKKKKKKKQPPCLVQTGLGWRLSLWVRSCCTRALVPVARGSARSHPGLGRSARVLLPAAAKLRQKKLHWLQQLCRAPLYLVPAFHLVTVFLAPSPVKLWARLLCFGKSCSLRSSGCGWSPRREVQRCGCLQERYRQALSAACSWAEPRCTGKQPPTSSARSSPAA